MTKMGNSAHSLFSFFSFFSFSFILRKAEGIKKHKKKKGTADCSDLAIQIQSSKTKNLHSLLSNGSDLAT